jgi:omega-amidase
MKDLKISIVQCDLQWEQPEANRAHIQSLLDDNSFSSDLIVLPEMFTTGFSMNTSLVAEVHHENMTTLAWMRALSKEHDAVVCGSISIKDQDQFYNRLYWVRPDESFSHYDKRHTFSFAREDQFYERGSSRIIEVWRGWKICPLICYDLRFPVWSRNGLENGEPLYDVLVYVANWPEARREPWMKLQFARAIENQAYLASCNRIGVDGKGISYTGDSMILSPKGDVIVSSEPGVESILNVELSAEELLDFRKKFPVLHDADTFFLK